VKIFKRRKQVARLSIAARLDFDIADEEAFLSHVRWRLTKEHGYSPEGVVEHTKDIEQVMLMLFEMDEWSVDYEKEGIEFGGSECTVDRIETSLAEPSRLTLVARWDVLVRNEDALLSYVQRRLVTEGTYDSDSVVEHTKSSEAAMKVLFELDGWTVDYQKEQLSLLGKEVRVKSVEKTLWEMDDDEWVEPRL
jgi:hypothetical protein